MHSDMPYMLESTLLFSNVLQVRAICRELVYFPATICNGMMVNQISRMQKYMVARKVIYIYIYYIHIFLICTAREAVSTQVGGQLANPTATVEGSEGATTVRGVCTIYTPYRSRECWPRANLPTASGKLVVLAVYAFGGDPLIGAN